MPIAAAIEWYLSSLGAGMFPRIRTARARTKYAKLENCKFVRAHVTTSYESSGIGTYKQCVFRAFACYYVPVPVGWMRLA
jgi:hypothetical protein